MPKSMDPFRLLLIAVAGWMNQQQLELIDYLREENRVLREQLGEKRLRFNDDQRRRLAAKAKGSKALSEVATIVTPETPNGSRCYCQNLPRGPAKRRGTATIQCKQRLGGLLKYYKRRAA